MEWIQAHGVRFRRLATYFINSSRERLQPVGGGEGLIRALLPVALGLGVEIRYESTATALEIDGGRVAAVQLRHGADVQWLRAQAVVIASGGFEGNAPVMTHEFGADASELVPIAPSVALNLGEGIEMALAAGAARSGEWSSFHAEPVDPRSNDAEAVVMVFPYGILVNRDARRFVDEGAGTVDEIYESVSREIWRQPGNAAFFVTDEHFNLVEARERRIHTGVKPVTADTLPDRAEKLGVPAATLVETVSSFNAATDEGSFDWRVPDGLSTNGLEPAKSNWARAEPVPVARKRSPSQISPTLNRATRPGILPAISRPIHNERVSTIRGEAQATARRRLVRRPTQQEELTQHQGGPDMPQPLRDQANTRRSHDG